LLRDDRVTSEDGPRRTVSRASLIAACQKMNLDDQQSVVETFVLVMAWGTGITGSRGVRNTRLAVAAGPAATECLAESAQALRRSSHWTTQRCWRPTGRGPCLRWGRPSLPNGLLSPGSHTTDTRPWNPLILDKRVHESLNRTLAVSTIDLADSRLRRRRYWAYVAAMHDWAALLHTAGQDIDAERLEWNLFAHNGGTRAKDIHARRWPGGYSPAQRVAASHSRARPTGNLLQ
jgi:hypothetical protein